MASAQIMMMSTTSLNGEMSHEHSVDQGSRPSTACSSSDMCTPMPHTSTHTFESKRFSTTSTCSSTCSTPFSTATSDIESLDSLAPASDPLDTHNLSATQQGIQGHFTAAKSQDDSAFYAAIQSWHTGNSIPTSVTKSSELDALAPDSAEHSTNYDAFTHWRSPGASQDQSVYDYRPSGPSVGDVGGHSRSDSYQSTISSMDSWNSSNHSDHNIPFPSYPNGLAASFSQMSLNSLGGNGLPTMPMYPPTLGARMKQNPLDGALSLPVGSNLKSSGNTYNNLAHSLATLSAAYPTPQVGYGSPSLLDPQALMAYSAAFGSSPLLDLYGLTPEYISARTALLAQLANSGPFNCTGLPANQPADDGPSPANKKTNLYKTELCRSWEEKGTCRYGSKCQFAHGQDELKNVSRHPKFKTEICRTFWLHGSCPYGKRCCFLHTTATDAGVPTVPSATEAKPGKQSDRNVHDPPTSRLQQRISSGPLSATPPGEKSLGVSLTNYLSNGPQLQSAPVARSLSDMGHSRSDSNSSGSISSDGSSRIESLRIQIGPRFGARDQVPAQDAPGPRSRLERLRPTGDYVDSTNSMPSTSTASTTRYSPFLDRHQPPHSAFSDISAILARSPSQHISKARSANGDAESQCPSSRLSTCSIAMA